MTEIIKVFLSLLMQEQGEALEYLIEQNRILLEELKKLGWKPNRLDDRQRKSLASKAKVLKKEIRGQVVNIAQPATVLAWYRKLVEESHKKSKQESDNLDLTRKELEQLILQLADENDWGYGKICDALDSFGIDSSKSTVQRILKKLGIEPEPNRPKGSWKRFLSSHADVWATDFFTTKYWSLKGTVEVYVLFFINIHTKEVIVSGMTQNPNKEWMKQQARNLTGFEGELEQAKYLIHDQDKKYCDAFIEIMEDSGTKCIKTAVMKPNMNAYAERFVRSIKEECLSHFMLFSEKQLRYVISEYVEFFHYERRHQGLKHHITPFPNELYQHKQDGGQIIKQSRLGGILNTYYRLPKVA